MAGTPKPFVQNDGRIGALDWLLYDWLMAHRDGPDSAEIVFPRGYDDAAALVVSAAAASVSARVAFDPGLVLAAPRGR